MKSVEIVKVLTDLTLFLNIGIYLSLLAILEPIFGRYIDKRTPYFPTSAHHVLRLFFRLRNRHDDPQSLSFEAPRLQWP